MNSNEFLSQISPYWDRLYHLAFNILGNAEESEDAVQETILRAADKIHQFQGNSALYTWIVRILINHCYDRLRKQKRQPKTITLHTKNNSLQEMDVIDQRETPEKNLELSDQSQRLMTMIQTLKPDLRAAVTLKYYENMTTQEISELLGIPDGTVKSRLSLARTQLRKELAKIGIEALIE